MKDFIRQRLLEAIKDIKHFVKQRYPERIIDLLDQIGGEGKKIIDERIDFIESLEFGDYFGSDFGIIIYKSEEAIKPKNDLPGHLLVLVVKDNVITTLFWKHIVKGQYDYVIKYEDLIEFVNDYSK